MAKNIPTEKVTIGNGTDSKEVELFLWMTQDEEDRYNAILLGNFDVDVTKLNKKDNDVSVKLSPTQLAESNKFLMQTMCTTPWEEINNWKPSLRVALLDKIQELKGKN